MTEKTAEELAAEEAAAAKARGDIVEEGEESVEEGEESVEEGEESVEEGEESVEGGEESVEEEVAERKPILIPKARFDQAQKAARERAELAEAKLAALEARQPVKAADTDALRTEISALQDKYEDLLIEGERDRAREVRKQVDDKREELIEQRLTQQSQATGNAAVEQMRFDMQLAQIEAKNPSLNPDSGAYDEVLATEVSEVLSAFKARGYTATAALQKAVHYVVRTDDTTAEDPDIKRSQRGQQARKAVAAAAKKAAPDLTKVGRSSAKDDGLPDVTKMTPEQFAKLDEAALSKLRGDSLASGEAA